MSKNIFVVLTPENEELILKLRMDKRFSGCTYEEIISLLVEAGGKEQENIEKEFLNLSW